MIFQPEMLDTNKPMPVKMGRDKKTRRARVIAARAPQPALFFSALRAPQPALFFSALRAPQPALFFSALRAPQPALFFSALRAPQPALFFSALRAPQPAVGLLEAGRGLRSTLGGIRMGADRPL
jgi:hypothetical protein